MSEQPEQPDPPPPRRLAGAQRAQAFHEPVDATEYGPPLMPPPVAPRTYNGHTDAPSTAVPVIAPPHPADFTDQRVVTTGARTVMSGQSNGSATAWVDSYAPSSYGGGEMYSNGGWSPPAPKEKPAEWGRKPGVIRVLSLGLAHSKAGPDELEWRDNVRGVRHASWPRCARIVIANSKGGVGKTPLAIGLGGKLAQIRGGGVVIWDAADSAGTTGSRAEGRPARCISEVEQHPDDYAQPGTISAAVATQSSFADVLASLYDREFTGKSIKQVLWTLDRSYRISVADTGNVPHSSAFKEVMRQADLLVVPTSVTKDSVDKAVGLLRRYRDSPSGLVPRAVVAVMDNHGPVTPGLAGAIEGTFRAEGVGAVVHIPFEPAIAAGVEISLGDFRHESDIAWTRLAAACTSNLITAPERT